MNSHPINTALIELHRLISPATTEWLVIGTSSLFLLGFDVKPNDIDILCTKEDACQIEKGLSAYRLIEAPAKKDKFRSVFSKYLIGGVKVEVMGGLEVNAGCEWKKVKDNINYPQQVRLNDYIFSVPSITDQLIIYKLFGREKDKPIIKMLSKKMI